MRGVSFEDKYKKPSPVRVSQRADSFGLSTFLLKNRLAKNAKAAKKMSNLIMLVAVIVFTIFILVINSRDGDSIDEKYYYNPAMAD
jgi:hypothetical protein